MSKKTVLIIVSLVVLFFGIILFINQKNHQKNLISNNIQRSGLEGGEEVKFKDEAGNEYVVKYNEGSYIYEIYNKQKDIVAVAEDYNQVELYMENPELMFAINEEIEE